MSELLIGRQPIFNTEQDVIGYELLYRTPESKNVAKFRNGDQATGQVILDSFSSIGLENIVGEYQAFLNITENFLIGKYPVPFPPKRIALEVLETINFNNEVINALTVFSHMGYTIVLDDVCTMEQIKPVLNLATIIKIDLARVNRQSLPFMVNELKRHHKKVLAEKVETLEEFTECKKLKFDYFQGYFLCRPNLVHATRIDSSQIVIMNALAQIQDPGVSFKKVEDTIFQDVTISYKLLRLINSAYFSTTMTVNSIHQAISMIGINYLRGWLMLLLLTTENKKPHELTNIALIRARFSELLAKASGKRNPDAYFMTGLLSVMNALLDKPMEEVIKGLYLSEDITSALLEESGDVGRILSVVKAYEHGFLEQSLRLGLDTQTITMAYLKSLRWAAKLEKTLQTIS